MSSHPSLAPVDPYGDSTDPVLAVRGDSRRERDTPPGLETSGGRGSARKSAPVLAGAVGPLDECQKGIDIDRLDQGVIKAGFPRPPDRLIFAVARQADDANTGEIGLAAEALGHVVTIHLGEPDVEQDDLRPQGTRGSKRSAAVMGDFGALPG